MRPLIVAFTVAASPVAAEKIACSFTEPCAEGRVACLNAPLPLSFEIDHRQFAPPIDAKEPPRRKVTLVSLGDVSFQAEPIVMDDGTRGFWADIDGVEHLMTMRANGIGTYASTGDISFMSGRCGASK